MIKEVTSIEDANICDELLTKLIPKASRSSYELVEDFAKMFNMSVDEYIKDAGFNTFEDYLDKYVGVSKVVDNNGEPLIVYHTVSGDVVLRGQADFTVFDPNYESNKNYNTL